jgi:hypothetical protein
MFEAKIMKKIAVFSLCTLVMLSSGIFAGKQNDLTDEQYFPFWSVSSGSDSIHYSSPLLDEGNVYAGSSDGYFRSIRLSDAHVNWSLRTGGEIYSEPLVFNSRIVFGSMDGSLYCVDMQSGALVWTYRAENSFAAPPVLDGGRLFALCNGGAVLSLNTNGALLWTKRFDGYTWAPLTVRNNRLLLVSLEGEAYCLDPDNGNSFWTNRFRVPVRSAPVIGDNDVYIASYAGEIVRYNLPSGRKNWSFQAGAPIFSTPVPEKQNIYFADFSGTVYSLDINRGRLNWSYKTTGRIYSPLTIKDNRLWFGTQEGKILALDTGTGQLITSISADTPVRSKVCFIDRCLVFQTSDGVLRCYRTTNELPNTEVASGRQADRPPIVANGQKSGIAPSVVISSGAIDTGGSISSDVPVAADTEVPVLSVSGVQDGVYYNHDVSPVVTIADDNLKESTAFLDSSPFKNGTKLRLEKPYVLDVRGVDQAGNIALRSVHFEIDRTPPVIIFGNVEENGVYSEVIPSIRIVDRNPDETAIRITLNDADYSSGTPIVSDGDYRLAVKATDKAGNRAENGVSFKVRSSQTSNSLLFRASFNSSVAPDYCAEPTTVKGGVLTGNNMGRWKGEALSEDSLGLRYSSSGNINVARGTVMMWIKPVVPLSGKKGLSLFSLRNGKNQSPNKYTMNLVVQEGIGALLQIKDNSGNYSEYLLADNDDVMGWFENKTWTHLALGWDSASGRVLFWVNGNLSCCLTNGPWQSKELEEGDFISIGNSAPGNSGKNEVRIDEIRIYDRILSSQAVCEETGLAELTSVRYASRVLVPVCLQTGDSPDDTGNYSLENIPEELTHGLFVRVPGNPNRDNSGGLSVAVGAGTKVFLAFADGVTDDSGLAESGFQLVQADVPLTAVSGTSAFRRIYKLFVKQYDEKTDVNFNAKISGKLRQGLMIIINF